ncbi:MAG: 1,6-anhydro-N-acetylmuramyl-L-alanine amidase AmpD [Burkholderiales bacterium]|nr:1,6-anhydro-N-acetylmuramyl-L-alanine amidase AmpD [Burkholderiales bacterium]
MTSADSARVAQSAPTALWRDGWYRFARQLPSPNYGQRPSGIRVDLVVLHSISLPPGAYGGDAVQRLFSNQLDWEEHPYYKTIEGLQVSSHFFVQRTGELWQFVSCEDRAWHAGVSHYRGRADCNDDSIGIELEGLEGELFATAQYETLDSLGTALLQGYPIQHIAGHEDVAPGRKFDPGAGFDWARLQQGLGCGDQVLPRRSRPA